MNHKIIIIKKSFDENERLSDKIQILLKELQLELFSNGYHWIKSYKEIKNFYSNSGYIVIIDNDMYLMTEESVKYLRKNNDIHFDGTIISYFRYLKLKKLKKL
jgi:hypothetical protein